MDSAEEQKQELEALEAIFDKDFRLIDGGEYDSKSGSSSTARFEIRMDDADLDVKSRLVFKYTKSYPDDVPEISVMAESGLTAHQRTALQNYLVIEAGNQKGMAMIYSLHAMAKDWIASHADAAESDDDNEGTPNVAGTKRSQQQSELTFETRDFEAERKAEAASTKFHGTPVNVETFNEWNQKFMAEINEKRRKLAEASGEKKLTGRELFEQNKAVVVEDSSLFEEEDYVIEDEELFVEE
mmetsp:Transcript_13897/g.23728  ORF Transcript_13897/g.23728 Transcript_13897/m.23728 type:complete len:241 (+) Transcript_13897:87-809(+)|eukprot:CAMPEP_0184696840 /NCGR_PEP_ID=MMETSP0313-20130426/4011_1 /TAXON_ID=2792 /ORGANISM="Porphyridium aerugineum, Strain SAG 1380-2" /LENGTH=240 /DNA_ID=CAMNT_0027155555 /DNA_START=1 /DNA_END=723 /DNA_ORIENTATION=-